MKTKPPFYTSILAFAIIALLVSHHAEAKQPNVLFIAVDDLNDWVGYLGGHPQARTPHIDALAEKGCPARETFLPLHASKFSA
jgi:hypothetical protein